MATTSMRRRRRAFKPAGCLLGAPATLVVLCVLLSLARETRCNDGDTASAEASTLLETIAHLRNANAALRAEMDALRGERESVPAEGQGEPPRESVMLVSHAETKEGGEAGEDNGTLERKRELVSLRDTLAGVRKENLGPDSLHSMPELDEQVRACQRIIADHNFPVGEDEFTEFEFPRRYRRYVLHHNPKLKCKKTPSDPRLHPGAKLCSDSYGYVDRSDFRNSVMRQLRPSCQAWCLFSEGHPTAVAYHWDMVNTCYSAVDSSHDCLTTFKDDEKHVMDWLVADVCEDLIYLLAVHTVPRVDEDILVIRRKYARSKGDFNSQRSSNHRIREVSEDHQQSVVDMGNPYAKQQQRA